MTPNLDIKNMNIEFHFQVHNVSKKFNKNRGVIIPEWNSLD